MRYIFLIFIFILSGCGTDSSSNPFDNRASAAAWCNDGRGGVAYNEYGYVYCNNGESIKDLSPGAS